MAGHNKWSKIKRKKGAKDTARSTAFGKAALAIRAASRACSGDLSNLQLQSAISAAKALQLPKDRISDAIERGANPSAGEGELLNIRYDGMVPTKTDKIAIIVTALTDNKNRTAGNVRAAFTKYGGELLNSGANDWLFENVGVALVPKMKVVTDEAGIVEKKEIVDEDELLERALEGGATDIDFGQDEDEDEHALVKCNSADLQSLVAVLTDSRYNPTEFETRWVVKDESSSVDMDGDSAVKFEKFLDRMDDDVDITGVFHNAAI